MVDDPNGTAQHPLPPAMPQQEPSVPNARRIYLDAVADLATLGAAVTITFAATLTALGAGGLAIGIYDLSRDTNPAGPLSSYWVVGGAVLMAAGFFMAAWICASLLKHYVRIRGNRALLNACCVSGQWFLMQPGAMTAANVAKWKAHTENVLATIDPDRGLTTRWNAAYAAHLQTNGELKGGTTPLRDMVGHLVDTLAAFAAEARP